MIGRPVAVQRKLEYALAPGLEWTVQCYLDLETLRPDGDGGEPVAAIVDYKVKSTLHTQAKADHDPQAGLYLAGRWLEGDPAHEFCFAQIGKPGARRKQMSASLDHHAPQRRAAARHARADRAGRQPDRRLLPALRARRAVGVRRPRAAGSARRATAPTTRDAPAAAGCRRALNASTTQLRRGDG